MTSEKSNEQKEKTLRTLRILRVTQLLGAFGAAVVTVGFVVANSIRWFSSPEDWCSGLAYFFVLLEVMVLYLYMFVCFVDNADWKLPIPNWLGAIISTVIIVFLHVGPILMFVPLGFCETKTPSIGYSLLSPVTFVASLACFASACETSLDIRKKLDPSFKVCRGFS